MSFTHNQIWSALDLVAFTNGMTPSGLAKYAGLDSTTFNPSKRFNRVSGRPRWPTMEIVAAVLNKLDMDFKDFADMVESQPRDAAPAP